MKQSSTWMCVWFLYVFFRIVWKAKTMSDELLRCVGELLAFVWPGVYGELLQLGWVGRAGWL